MQLSYDDFDGTLNVHVIQGRGLIACDKNGLSDPFVKAYLLPGRGYVRVSEFFVQFRSKFVVLMPLNII